MPGFPLSFPYRLYVSPTYRRPIQYEVRDAQGRLSRIVGRPIDGEVQYRLNCPSQLTFRVAADDPAAGALLCGGEVWLRGQDNDVLGRGRYRIDKNRPVNGAEGPMIEIEATDCLSLLIDSLVLDYEAKDKTLGEIVGELFALQEGFPRAFIYEIHPDISSVIRSLKIESTGSDTIFSVLNNLEQTLPFLSCFWVDELLAFHWIPLSAVTDSGKVAVIGHNTKSVTRETDFTNLCTRLYVFGSNTLGKPLTIEKADHNGGEYGQRFIESPAAGIQFYKMITVDHKSVSPLGETNYHLDMSWDADADLAGRAAASISFVDNPFTAVPYAASWTAYDATTGAGTVTVTLPVVSGVVDTVFYMVFGSCPAPIDANWQDRVTPPAERSRTWRT